MDNSIFLLPEIDLSEYQLGKVKFLKVKEIIKYGDENLKQLSLPFLIKFFDETKELLLFEYMVLDKDLSNKMIEFLKIFYKTDHVQLIYDSNKNYKIVVISNEINNLILENPNKIEDIQNEIIIIDKNNFLKLSEIIYTSLFITKPKESEEDKQVIQVREENQAILKEYLKLREQAKKAEEERLKKNQPTLHQIITIVASQCLWNYDHVFNMTYYQLWNSYFSIVHQSYYQDYIRYATSFKYEIKEKQKHWLETVGKY